MKSIWKKINDTIRESQIFDTDGKRRIDQNSKFACFFTAAYSYFRAHYGLKLSWDKYKAECLKLKAIRNDFWLLNRDAMAIAAGVKAKCVEESGPGIAARALQIVTLGKTCLFSLKGEHYASIVGVEKFDSGDGVEKLRFLIEDPGVQNDLYANYDDLLCYREDKNGVRIYSKSSKGGKRLITKLYWWA